MRYITSVLAILGIITIIILYYCGTFEYFTSRLIMIMMLLFLVSLLPWVQKIKKSVLKGKVDKIAIFSIDADGDAHKEISELTDSEKEDFVKIFSGKATIKLENFEYGEYGYKILFCGQGKSVFIYPNKCDILNYRVSRFLWNYDIEPKEAELIKFINLSKINKKKINNSESK
ncbi:MAG: hypothetical protein ACRCUS_04960 [Anaerovoracaceae bacterium]